MVRSPGSQTWLPQIAVRCTRGTSCSTSSWVARRLPDGVLQLPSGLRRPQVLHGRALHVSAHIVISFTLRTTGLSSIGPQAPLLMPCSCLVP